MKIILVNIWILNKVPCTFEIFGNVSKYIRMQHYWLPKEKVKHFIAVVCTIFLLMINMCDCAHTITSANPTISYSGMTWCIVLLFCKKNIKSIAVYNLTWSYLKQLWIWIMSCIYPISRSLGWGSQRLLCGHLTVIRTTSGATAGQLCWLPSGYSNIMNWFTVYTEKNRNKTMIKLKPVYIDGHG